MKKVWQIKHYERFLKAQKGELSSIERVVKTEEPIFKGMSRKDYLKFMEYAKTQSNELEIKDWVQRERIVRLEQLFNILAFPYALLIGTIIFMPIAIFIKWILGGY